MNRKLLLLNLMLLTLAGLLGWQLRQHWLTARAEEAIIIEKKEPPAPVLPPPSPEPVDPAVPADYYNVAQQTLFSQDRDPSVVIVTEPPPPPKPLPPFPSYHGQMAMGEEPVILLSVDGARQKSYRAGDQLGELRLISFTADQATFEFDGRTVERRLEELKPAEGEAPPSRPAAKAASPARNPAPNSSAKSTGAGPAPGASVSSIGSPAGASANSGKVGDRDSKPKLGEQRGKFRLCAAGDESPAGTTAEGYRKVLSVDMIGTSCIWEPIQ